MSAAVQTILIPVIDAIPTSAIRYAEILAEAYNKPISFLCLDDSLAKELCAYDYPITISTKPLAEAVFETIIQQDAVMLVWESQNSSRQIKSQLLACRQLRIPYFFVPKGHKAVAPKQVALPIGFLIEEREKATWGRSLHRNFASQYTIVKPNDKGTRASKNIDFVEEFFTKNGITFTTVKGKKSSFKIDRESLTLLSDWADLMIITASREYGLDDQFFCPKELKVIKKSTLPIMVLNPRDDLYVLCGE